MKIISIYQENVQTIKLKDDDSTNKEIYIKKLSSLLSPDNNVAILTTSFKSIILRPSKITSILVDEIIDGTEKKIEEIKPEINVEIKEKEKEKEKIVEDIITDKQ